MHTSTLFPCGKSLLCVSVMYPGLPRAASPIPTGGASRPERKRFLSEGAGVDMESPKAFEVWRMAVRRRSLRIKNKRPGRAKRFIHAVIDSDQSPVTPNP